MSDKKARALKRRERNPLTFYEKIAVIRHHEANKLSRNSLARMFQCCTTQIRRILERRDEYLGQWQMITQTDSTAIVEEMSKKRKEFEMKAVGFILYQWVERCRQLQLNLVINDGTLKMIALKMATVLNIPEFRPSQRWIQKFRLKFKYKEEDLAQPRNASDPQGTLSVEDIIIEYKNYLPSFMRQEISKITSNDHLEEVSVQRDSNKNEEGSPSPCQERSPIQNEEASHHSENKGDGEDFQESEISENVDSLSDEEISEVTAENVLQYLSAVQQFSSLNSDYRAMAMVAELENHFKVNYFLFEEQDDENEIVLVE